MMKTPHSHFTIILKRMLYLAKVSKHHRAKVFLTVSVPKSHSEHLPRIIEYIRRHIDENAMGIYSETETNKHWHGFITSMYINEALPLLNAIREHFQKTLNLKSLNIYAKHISGFYFHNYFYKNMEEALKYAPPNITPKQIISVPEAIYEVISDTSAWLLHLINTHTGFNFFKWLIWQVWINAEDNTPEHQRAKQLYTYAMNVMKGKFIRWLAIMLKKAPILDNTWYNIFMKLLALVRPDLHKFALSLLKPSNSSVRNKRSNGYKDVKSAQFSHGKKLSNKGRDPT